MKVLSFWFFFFCNDFYGGETASAATEMMETLDRYTGWLWGRGRGLGSNK